LARILTFSLVGGTLAALALSVNGASAATVMTHVDTPPMAKITPPSHTFKPAAVTGGNSGVVYRNGNGSTNGTTGGNSGGVYRNGNGSTNGTTSGNSGGVYRNGNGSTNGTAGGSSGVVYRNGNSSTKTTVGRN
jgi:hypothetical protein